VICIGSKHTVTDRHGKNTEEDVVREQYLSWDQKLLVFLSCTLLHFPNFCTEYMFGFYHLKKIVSNGVLLSHKDE
jgi:hypothetical protein